MSPPEPTQAERTARPQQNEDIDILEAERFGTDGKRRIAGSPEGEAESDTRANQNNRKEVTQNDSEPAAPP